MAKKRDVIVAVVISVGFFIALGIMGLFFIGLMSGDGDYDIAGFGEKIGIVEMYGIMDEISGRPVVKQVDKWADNNSIKAIIVHINTPGGGVAISQEIYNSLKNASEKKPIVAAMSSVAASGGYYIACAADRIIANPGTVTGSIGVIFQFNTFEKLMDKVGVGIETIKSGELKDVGNYSRSMTKKEELMLRSVVMDTYEQFVAAVAEGRGMDPEAIYPLADGSIFTGLQALNLGLIDTLGGLNEAIDLAAELAEIKGKPSIVRPYKRKKVGLFDLMESLLIKLDRKFDNSVTGPELLFLYK